MIIHKAQKLIARLQSKFRFHPETIGRGEGTHYELSIRGIIQSKGLEHKFAQTNGIERPFIKILT